MTVAIVLLVMMSAYFSATETAFSCLNKIRMKSRAESGDHRAALAMDLVEDYDRLISTILIGNNIVNITASTVAQCCSPSCMRLTAPPSLRWC